MITSVQFGIQLMVIVSCCNPLPLDISGLMMGNTCLGLWCWTHRFFFTPLANYGPHATSAECSCNFPSRFSSIHSGISAAYGNLRAIVGAFEFLYLAENQDKARCIPWEQALRNSFSSIGYIQPFGQDVHFLGA